MIYGVDYTGTRQYSGKLRDDTVVHIGQTYDGQPVDLGGGGELLQLTNDPDVNRQLIIDALALGDVTLADGEYPINPEIEINGRTLDLGGATLRLAVEPFYNGAYFVLHGESPCIKNGKLIGNYAHAPNEPGYVPLERDGNGIETAVAIPQGKFGNGLIDSVEFDNICGYIICPRNETYEGRQGSPKYAPTSGWSTFAFKTNYPLITARHGIDYGYKISTEPVDYRFYDANHTLISEDSGIPGEPIAKPESAVSVEVKTYGTYVQYVLWEYEYDSSLTIDGCIFKCNQRLGIANLPGISTVRDCVSISNGYPREDHTGIGWDSSTSGFMDIEDIQTPFLYVDTCTSENENLGVATRAYKVEMSACQLPLIVYGGWEAEVANHTGKVAYNRDGVDAFIRVYDSVLTDMWLAYVSDKISIERTTIELCDALNKLPGFVCDADLPVRPVNVNLNGVVVGTITGSEDSKYIQLATKQGTDLTIELPIADDWEGVRIAHGDCYGITANSLVLPNHHTVYSCDFTVADERRYINSATTAPDVFTGEYNGCSFVISYNKPFRHTSVGASVAFDLTFTNCEFTMVNGFYLFGDVFMTGSQVTFNNCTLNGEPIDLTMASDIVCEAVGIIDVVVI